jgi:hypothetical protein
VLVIRYAELSPDPLTRLQTVAAIGKLLDAAKEPQRLSELSPSPASTHALQTWLDDKQVDCFWNVKDGLVVANRPCGKHVLVGTKLLLQDLSTVIYMPRLPRVEEIDLVWQAAGRLIEQDCTE